ncbi:MAG: AraC family transcriptional regulator [Ruminococcaceae bacterium]|nr:AraC family transcriptional regulator [Oscillospiraceae bacterium]
MHSENTNLSDLVNGLGVIYAGEQVCPPGHSYGPCARHYYLLHYIIEGCGIFETQGTRYALSAGDVFLIRPEEITYYEADRDRPWHYVWIGLSGMDAGNIFASISALSPVLHVENRDEITPLMRAFAQSGNCRTSRERFARLGKLYEILSYLAAGTPDYVHRSSGRIYAEEAAMFIHANLSRRISVAELARQIAIDRSYLCAVFKKYMGLSPQQYAIDLKMKSAANMLRSSDKSVSDIAASVGYADSLLFSRMFREKFGRSPRQYRAELTE